MTVQLREQPVIVQRASDSLLAQRAAAGDEQAFGELARRFGGLVTYVGRWDGTGGVTVDDLRQEALIALFDACRTHDPAKGPFGALARICVRNRLIKVRAAARRHKHHVVSGALSLDHPAPDGSQTPLRELLPDRKPTDPARVVELRERLAERVGAQYRPHPSERPDSGREYTTSDVAHACRLVELGASVRSVARELGACPATVRGWVKQAA